jgi:hypothetical protein
MRRGRSRRYTRLRAQLALPLFALLTLLPLLAGCGTPAGTAVAAITEPTATPTATPRPTATPSPTSTPPPPTPTPTPRPATPTTPPTVTTSAEPTAAATTAAGPTPAVATSYTVNWSKWPQGTTQDNSYRRSYDAAKNEYDVALIEDDLELSLFAPEGLLFQDFVMDVDARRVKGLDSIGYGLVFRRQPKGDNDKASVRYIFYVSPQGLWSLFLVNKDGTTKTIRDLNPSSSIKVGDATNHLTVTCKGQKITLAANGQPLATIDDATLTSPGEIGVFILSPVNEHSTEVAFKNLTIKPAP